VSVDEESIKKFRTALENIPSEFEKLTNLVKKREFGALVDEAEGRARRLSEKLEAMNKKWGLKL